MNRPTQTSLRRTSVLGVVVALGGALLAAPAATADPVAPPSATTAAGAAPAQFHAMSPSRILDTRTGSSLAAHGRTRLKVSGVAAPGATSVLLNVTATRAKATGYVTAYADGAARPATSNLTFTPGGTVADAVVAPVGGSGYVDLYNGSPGVVDLVVDLEGSYVPPATAAGGYVGLAPARLLDTRSGRGGHTPAAGATIAVPVAGLGGVASDATAAVVTLTATRATAPGYLTAWASGTPRPATSNVVFATGVTVSTAALVPIGSDGRISLRNGSTRPVDAVVDVVGYLTAGSSPATGSTVPLPPARVLDTRSSAPVPANTAVSVTLPGHGGVPSTHADAVVLTVTATRASEPGYLSVYRYGESRKPTSVLNFVAGQTVSNLVVLPLGTGGRVQIFNGSAGHTQAVVDVAGYVVADPAWHDETPAFPGGPPAVSTETTYAGVSCQAAGQCVTLGTGPKGVFADSVVRGTTTRTILGVPKGVTYADTGLVSCVAAGCTILRSVEIGTVRNLLLYTRAGSGWAYSNLGDPFGPGDYTPSLTAMSCPAVATCTVVGSIGDVSPDYYSIVHLEISGGKYRVDTSDADDDTNDQFPSDVSCRAVDDCVLSGYETTGAGETQIAFVERLRAGVWTRTAVPNPANARATAVSCRPGGDCLVVGSAGDEASFAATVNGATGAVAAVAAPPVRPQAVSCAATTCVAVGTSGNTLQAAAFDGSTWTSSPVGAPSGGTSGPVYTGVSCPTDSSCLAVGDAVVHIDDHRQGMVSTYADGTWTTTSLVPAAGPPAGTADAVSCSSDGTCTVIGSRATRDGTSTLYARQRTSAGWSSVVDLPAPVDRYDDVGADGVSCASASTCVAVLGPPRAGSGESPAAAEVLSGGSWSLSVLPLPDGAVGSLVAGVSCASATHCVAVGQVIGTAGDPTPATWTWNGTTWTVASIPLPGGVTTATTTGISCVTDTHCVVSASSGTHALALTLDGGAWTSRQISGIGYLSDVSCTSTTQCTGVAGRFGVSFEGGTWTATIVTSVLMTHVSCRSAGFCVASADQRGVVLDQGTWTTTAFLPVGSAAGSATPRLSDVSCGPTACVEPGSDTDDAPYAEVLD